MCVCLLTILPKAWNITSNVQCLSLTSLREVGDVCSSISETSPWSLEIRLSPFSYLGQKGSRLVITALRVPSIANHLCILILQVQARTSVGFRTRGLKFPELKTFSTNIPHHHVYSLLIQRNFAPQLEDLILGDCREKRCPLGNVGLANQAVALVSIKAPPVCATHLASTRNPLKLVLRWDNKADRRREGLQRLATLSGTRISQLSISFTPAEGRLISILTSGSGVVATSVTRLQLTEYLAMVKSYVRVVLPSANHLYQNQNPIHTEYPWTQAGLWAQELLALPVLQRLCVRMPSRHPGSPTKLVIDGWLNVTLRSVEVIAGWNLGDVQRVASSNY